MDLRQPQPSDNMIKRPLDIRFADKVRDGIKTTTVRDKPWPVNTPIMLHHWSGKPYRSKHKDVAAIKVTGFWTICISKYRDGSMHYICGRKSDIPLYQAEGFESQKEMDDWFNKLVQYGETIEKTLIAFHTIES